MFKTLSPSFFIMVALVSHACKLYFDLGIWCHLVRPLSTGWWELQSFPFSLGGLVTILGVTQ